MVGVGRRVGRAPKTNPSGSVHGVVRSSAAPLWALEKLKAAEQQN